MKVTETITRECCDDRRDFKPLFGNSRSGRVFCRVCGKRWRKDSFTDAAGGKDYRYVDDNPYKEEE